MMYSHKRACTTVRLLALLCIALSATNPIDQVEVTPSSWLCFGLRLSVHSNTWLNRESDMPYTSTATRTSVENDGDDSISSTTVLHLKSLGEHGLFLWLDAEQNADAQKQILKSGEAQQVNLLFKNEPPTSWQLDELGSDSDYSTDGQNNMLRIIQKQKKSVRPQEDNQSVWTAKLPAEKAARGPAFVEVSSEVVNGAIDVS